MGDSILNYDFNSMIESPPLQDAMPPPVKAAETAEPPATAEPTPAAPVYDEDYETPEAVENVLRAELGEEKFTEMYDGASRFVQEFAKYNPASFEILAARLGNHPEVIKALYTISCMMDGCRPQKPPAAPSTSEIDAELKDIIEPGGKHYDRWRLEIQN